MVIIYMPVLFGRVYFSVLSLVETSLINTKNIVQLLHYPRGESERLGSFRSPYSPALACSALELFIPLMSNDNDTTWVGRYRS